MTILQTKGRPSSFQREHKTTQMQRIKNGIHCSTTTQKLEGNGTSPLNVMKKKYLLSELIIGSILKITLYHFTNQIVLVFSFDQCELGIQKYAQWHHLQIHLRVFAFYFLSISIGHFKMMSGF